MSAESVAPSTPARRRQRPAPVRRGRHLPTVLYGALIVTVFAGVIGVSSIAGVWQTSGRTVAGGGAVTLTGTSTTEIKGWMTIGAVSEAYGIPLADILTAFALDPATPPETPVKDLESDLFSVTALRDWIDLQGVAVP